MEDKKDKLMKKLNNFVSNFLMRWKKSSRTKANLESKFASWLDCEFNINEFIILDTSTEEETQRRPRGRPSKDFTDLTNRAKRRRIADNDDDAGLSIEEVFMKVRRKAYLEGQHNLVKVIGHILRNKDDAQLMFTKMKTKKGNKKILPSSHKKLIVFHVF
jgi:hypothetical protein